MIDVALVGCGHMGRLHARTIAQAPGTRLVAVCDRHSDRAEALAQMSGARAVDEVPSEVDAVVIATPTASHLTVAAPLLERKQWCLVEKPVVSSSSAFEGLDPDHPQLFVGHVERFNPAVRVVGRMRAQVTEMQRLARPSGRNQGVCVVRDLMIHDLDLLLWWSDASGVPEIQFVSGQRDAQGVCNHLEVALSFADDRQALLMASRVAEAPARHIRCRGSQTVVELDLLNGKASRGAESLKAIDQQDGLSAQWRAFTTAVNGKPTQVARGRDGLRALKLAERVVGAMERIS